MVEAPKTRRRWFQFGMRSLLGLILMLALLLFAANEHRERRRLTEKIDLIDRHVQTLDTEMRRQRGVAQRRELLDTIDVPRSRSK
jgi:hypothetical protein